MLAVLQPSWWGALPVSIQYFLWGSLVAGGIGLVLAIRRFSILSEERMLLRERVAQQERLTAEAYQRLEAIFQVSQKFVEATDEKEVVEMVLRLAVDLLGATGASFVPIDEHGQSAAAISHGDLPFPLMNDWVEYLASPSVRERCRICESHGALTTACPLLNGPISDARGIFCLPLRRGEREFGVLNLYLSSSVSLDDQTKSFLLAMVDETALALESVRLRRRELEALRQMQAVRQKTDLAVVLSSLLDNIHQTLEGDFSLLVIPQPSNNPERLELKQGEVPAQAQPFLNGILQAVMHSGEPVILGDVAGDPASTPGVRSLIASPLLSSDQTALGAILVGNCRLPGFHPRQLVLLQTISGQVALVVQNASLMAELEYKAVLEERTRLAREIHDGLAQTLGFLKLQVAQMQNYLTRQDWERLRESTALCYATLNEAYQDARQAIDGLRIYPGESGLTGWLRQMVVEFEDLSGLRVDLGEVDLSIDLPPEVHVQLIRIVQEALSNVRKHAQAQNVWIAGYEDGSDLWLEIRDDGVGFSPEDISGPSRHGLRGMRERSELIGADFQVASRPGNGTSVRVRLPLKLGEVAS